MKKILSLILVSVLILLSLTSCKLFGGKDEEKDPSDNNNSNIGEKPDTKPGTIWSMGIDTIVVAEEKTGDSEWIRFHISNVTEKKVGFNAFNHTELTIYLCTYAEEGGAVIPENFAEGWSGGAKVEWKYLEEPLPETGEDSAEQEKK